MIIPEFTGGRDQDVLEWLDLVEQVCLKRPMGNKEWVDVGYFGLSEDVTKVMIEVEHDLNKLTPEKWVWSWNTFKTALIGIEKQVKDSRSALEKLDDLRRKNPKTFTGVGFGLLGLASIPLAPAALVGGLHMIGFSSAGPVAAGTIAAGVRAAVYGGRIASGSAFALAQSAAAGGVAVASTSTLTAGAGAAAVGTWLQVSKPNDPPPDAWPITLRASNDLLLALLHERKKGE